MNRLRVTAASQDSDRVDVAGRCFAVFEIAAVLHETVGRTSPDYEPRAPAGWDRERRGEAQALQENWKWLPKESITLDAVGLIRACTLAVTNGSPLGSPSRSRKNAISKSCDSPGPPAQLR